MPEGDSVRDAARRLDRALSGATLQHAELRWPSLGGVQLTGREVLETVSVGKHLLTRLAGTDTRPALSLHTHLRMEGRWRTWPIGPRRPARIPGARTGARVVLATASALAVGFRLGMVDLVPTEAEHSLVGHLGPDILGPEWDPDEALRRLRSQPDRQIGEAFLDQRLLAGLGTYWASETLYLQGIRPTTVIADAAALPKLVVRLPGLLGAPRRPEPLVYGLRGRQCRRCGQTIRRVTVGREPTARELFFCPGCQPAPADLQT